jgi:hypothetical protein
MYFSPFTSLTWIKKYKLIYMDKKIKIDLIMESEFIEWDRMIQRKVHKMGIVRYFGTSILCRRHIFKIPVQYKIC